MYDHILIQEKENLGNREEYLRYSNPHSPAIIPILKGGKWSSLAESQDQQRADQGLELTWEWNAAQSDLDPSSRWHFAIVHSWCIF